MPKLKTNRSAAKRFKKTGSGKIKRAKQGSNHFTGKKASKSIRNLRKSTLVSDADLGRISKLLPY
ncbi:50S ribosomal protein L35 [Sedimentibacter sp. MB31-C6]|uniref:50S ribosomal protein L35 n=1 Tax=Sedimentibacter sp. MB31-C6 TaxID=3109366 RepID=UPI002DDD6097|nr:50S ribosomal protein L35 [Sedimentibacter sp. MB36-C1]WSI03749.1 50S ribosomal protein L35 [Sedimentibacter sp. MB36-C1]